MMLAVDYSSARPDLAGLKAAGYVGVLRYLNVPANDKTLTADEVVAIKASGLALGVVWETSAGRASEGFAAGAADAVNAERLADDLGLAGCIYYAVDFGATVAQVTPYFQGVRSAARRPVGGYGSYAVVEGLLNAGLVAYAWQTAAWSAGQRSNRVHLYQQAGAAPAGCDVDEVVRADWGQTDWSPPVPVQPVSAAASSEDSTVAIVTAPGRVDLFVVGTDHHIYQATGVDQTSLVKSAWKLVGGDKTYAKTVSAAWTPDYKQLYLTVQGADDHPYVCRWDSVAGAWSELDGNVLGTITHDPYK